MPGFSNSDRSGNSIFGLSGGAGVPDTLGDGSNLHIVNSGLDGITSGLYVGDNDAITDIRLYYGKHTSNTNTWYKSILLGKDLLTGMFAGANAAIAAPRESVMIGNNILDGANITYIDEMSWSFHTPVKILGIGNNLIGYGSGSNQISGGMDPPNDARCIIGIGDQIFKDRVSNGTVGIGSRIYNADSPTISPSDSVMIGSQIVGAWTSGYQMSKSNGVSNAVLIGYDIDNTDPGGGNVAKEKGNSVTIGRSLTSANEGVVIGYGLNAADRNITTSGGFVYGSILIGNSLEVGPFTDPLTRSNTMVFGRYITGASERISIGSGASQYIYADFTTGSSWSFASDGRYKTDIQDTQIGLDFVNSLSPREYRWKRPSEIEPGLTLANRNDYTKKYGFIAQEVKSAMDQAGFSDFSMWQEDDNGLQFLSLDMLVVPLVNAVKELTVKIQDLSTRIEALEAA